MSKVTIYTTRTCPYCKLLKEYLREKNIDFDEKHVDTDQTDAQKSVDTCGSLGVPCTHITGKNGKMTSVLGFDKTRIEKELKKIKE